MTWKQPVPVHIEGLDPFSETIYQKLVIMATNEPKIVNVGAGYVRIKRGECVVGRSMLAEMFGLQPREQLRVYRKLVRLQKVNNLVKLRKGLNCTVVSIQNYDEIVGMNNPMNNRRTIDEQSMNTNKSNKSVKKLASSSKPTKKKTSSSLDSPSITDPSGWEEALEKARQRNPRNLTALATKIYQEDILPNKPEPDPEQEKVYEDFEKGFETRQRAAKEYYESQNSHE